MKPKLLKKRTRLDATAIKRLANRIVTAMFTNVTGQRADMVILFGTPSLDGARNELGGWCERAAAREVEGIITESLRA
jgi:hypothetical protein